MTRRRRTSPADDKSEYWDASARALGRLEGVRYGSATKGTVVDEEYAICADCNLRVRHWDPAVVVDMAWNHERITGHSSGWDYFHDELEVSRLPKARTTPYST